MRLRVLLFNNVEGDHADEGGDEDDVMSALLNLVAVNFGSDRCPETFETLAFQASEKTVGARGTAVAAAVSVGPLRRTWLMTVRCHLELGLLGLIGFRLQFSSCLVSEFGLASVPLSPAQAL